MLAFSLFSNRFGTSASFAPAANGNSVFCGSIIKIVNLAPLFERLFNSVNFNKSISFIVGLLCYASPSAIARLIVAVVVDPVKSGAFWSIAHILNKLDKIAPSFTNAYASCTVIFKLVTVWIVAPRPHAGPDLIKLMAFFCSFVRKPVRGKRLSPVTSTRFSAAAGEVAGMNSLGIATIARAKPLLSVAGMFNLFNNCKKSEFVVSEIFVFSHFFNPCDNIKSHQIIS